MGLLEIARRRRLRPLAVFAVAHCLGGLCFAAAAAASDSAAAPAATSDAAAAPAAEPSVRAPIPVAEIPARAGQTVARLHELKTRLASSMDLGAIEAAVSENGAAVWTGAANTNTALQQGVRLSSITDISRAWKEARDDVSERSASLAVQGHQAQDALDEVGALRDEWMRTAEEARTSGAPLEVRTQIEGVTSELASGAAEIVALRDRLLVLQAQTERQLAVSDEIIDRLDLLEVQTARRLGERNAPPLWQGWRDDEARGAAVAIALETRNELRLSARFVMKHAYAVVIALVLLGALGALFRGLRARAATWRREGSESGEQLAILDRPYSMALVLTLTCVLLTYQTMPRLLFHILGILVVIPGLRIAQRFLEPALLRPLYVLVALRVADRVFEFLSPSHLVEQVAICVTLSVALVFLIRSVVWGGAREIRPDASHSRWRPPVRVLVALVAVDIAVGIVAAAAGYLQLALVLVDIPLFIANAGLLFYTAARVILGLWELLLETKPFASLRMVQSHRELIARRSRSVVGLLAVAGWLVSLRNSLSFLGFRSTALEHVAAATAHFGSVALSVGEIVAACVTIWVSFLLSRLVRFVMEEEVFPRIRLTQGVPYALSMLTHYAILATGLLLGLATLGFDPSRLTVIVGALGVGIGFGLQTIVNNLSSGLILLFERPIKVGDTVQVGTMTGEVKRIGSRSSTVRTGDGAEMIVPNATLVSETVTNWTLSDRSRRFELTVGVAYGTKPAAVMAILKETAERHAEVLRDPGPVALFIGFGESSLDFQLKAWVGDGGRLSAVKSDVGLALSEAFDAAGIEIPYPQRQLHIVETKES